MLTSSAFYDKWQKNDIADQRIPWSKEEFLQNITLAEYVAVIFGNMNYQVGNGGWSQWMYNKYGTPQTKKDIIYYCNQIGSQNALKVIPMVKAARSNSSSDEYCDSYYSFNEDFMVEVNDYLEKTFKKAMFQTFVFVLIIFYGDCPALFGVFTVFWFVQKPLQRRYKV